MTQPSPASRPAPLSPAQSTVAERLAEIVGERHVLSRPSELLVYNSDGLPGYRRQPRLAVFPGSREETIAVVRLLADEGLPFVPRGAGTGLSGGALADDIVVIGIHRLKKIISLDVDNRRATVEPGVVNLRLNKHVAPYGLLYAPDPSSEAACTIGGNVAENAGGPHCLKYGVTLNHVLALTVVLPSGEVVELGSKVGEPDGYDLRGAFIGSEGCFGLALDITVKLTAKPQTVRTLLADFMSVDAAAHVTSAIIASGIVPAALEFMDGATIRVVEDSIYAAGYPRDAEAILLIELDGLEAGVSADLDAVRRICIDGGARNVKVARDDAERMKLWQGRKKAFGAMGRMAPHLIVQDAVIPRTRLPEILATIRRIGEKYGVMVCNVFHAGDGNLHPNIPYSADDPEEAERVHKAMIEIMQASIDAGGSITGEHGVGLDKIGYMEAIFSESSLNAMCELRGVFDPERRSNPGKVVPLHACKEWNAVAGSRLRMNSSPPAHADDDLPGSMARPLEAEPTLRRVSTEAVVTAIKESVATGMPLRIAGRSTWLDAGRPVRATKTISLRDDSGVVSYVPGDLTLTVRAGTPLSEIERVTKEHNQWLPLDPYGSPDGTIGATIATASAGPLSTGFGLPRDLLLGLEFVNGRGEVVRGGGKVVKNVAGFDLSRLMTGSWGTLGVITEVTLRLYASPATDRTFSITLDGGEKETAALIHAIATSPVSPYALQLLSRSAAHALGLGNNPVCVIRLGGNDAVVNAQLIALSRISLPEENESGLWSRLRQLEANAHTTIRISGLPTKVLAGSATIIRDDIHLVYTYIDPRRGTLRIALSADETDGVQSSGAIGSAGDFHTPGNGSSEVIFEKLPAEIWQMISPSVVSDQLSQGVKQAFDPHTILNPGILGD